MPRRARITAAAPNRRWLAPSVGVVLPLMLGPSAAAATESDWAWVWPTLVALGAAVGGAFVWDRTLARRVAAARAAAPASERTERERSERLATLGTLMASIAHEVNNPNHAIMLNTPVLRDAWRDALAVLDAHAAETPGLRLANGPFAEMREDIARMVDEIERAAVRIRDIVAAIRGYARDQSRREYTTFDLTAAVRAAIEGRRELVATSGRAFTVDLPEDLVIVRGHRLQIEQAVAEFVANACEGSRDPTQTIVLALRVEASASAAVLEVCCRGRGIPNDRLRDAVRPFSAARGPEEGMELGLPIAAWIVQQHGGQIEIEANAGEGTRVRVRLPIAGA